MELKNFLSYSNATVEIPSGFIILHGENGAGKTSLIDAIAYALSSKPASRKGVKQSELIRKGSTFTEVKLYFEIGSRKYMVERRFGKGRASEAYLYDLNNRRRIAHGTSSVNKEIARILGFESVNAAIESMFVPQGRLTELIELGPSELRDRVIEIIGIGKRDNITNKLNEVIKNYEIKASKLEFKAKMYRKQKEKITELRKKRRDLHKKVSELNAKLDKMEKELTELSNKIDEMRSAYEKYRRLNEELRIKKEKLREINERFEQLKVNEEDLNAIVEELKNMEKRLKNKQVNEYIVEQLRRASKLRNEIEEMKMKLMKIKVTDDDERTIVSKIDEIRKEKEQLAMNLSKIKERCKHISKELETKKENLKRVKALLNGKSMEEIIAEIMSLDEILDKLESKKDELRTLKAELESKLSLIDDSLGALKNSKGKCPVCGAPLNELKRRELIERKLKEKEELKKRYDDIEKELSNVRLELERYKKRLDDLKQTYNKVEAILDSLGYKDVEELKRDVEKLENEIKKYKNDIKQFEEKYDSLKSTESKLNEKLERIRQQLKEKKEIQAMLTEKRRALNELLKQFNLSDDAIDEALDTYKKELEKLNELEKRKAQLEELREEIQKKLNEKNHLKGIKDNLEEEINKILKDLDELNFNETEYAKVKEEYENKKQEKDSIFEKLKRYEGMLKEVDNNIEERMKELKELEESAKEYEEIRNFIDFLKDFKAKIPSIYNTISENFRRVWEVEANKLLQNFDLSISSIKIVEEKRGRSEGWVIEAIGDSGRELKVETLSGGEKVGVSLAMKLALVKMLSRGKVSVLVLDEPTVNLDEERKRRLKEILLKAVGPALHQLIVVTHDQEVLDVAEYVCRVRKGARGSEVVCDTQ